MNCNDAVAALVASLENGTPMTDEQRAHIRDCTRCRELLDSAKQFQTLLGGNGIQSPPVDATLAAAEDEVRRKHLWRAVRIGIGVIVLLGAAVAVLLNRLGDVPLRNAMIMGSAAMVAGVLIGTPIVLLLWVVRGKTRGGERRLYKRLGRGRMISGVCLGIAEATGVDVSIIRIAFVVLLLAEGVGFWLYFLLAFTMAIHPDDRQHLLRFRLRRWWQRRLAHAENHAR